MAAMAAPGVRLITAASDGDKKGVKKWLDQGVDVDSRDWDNLTPLIAASSQGHLVRASPACVDNSNSSIFYKAVLSRFDSSASVCWNLASP